jgi:16S rRNA (adenine1518-N6/adenine1519-N6)-dimethyltransferase
VLEKRMPRARKRFGQNFLEAAWVDKVIRAIDPGSDDVFVEIGPGRGALTRPLAARVQTVAAYEIDRDLAAELEATAPSNVRVIEGDFLAITASLSTRDYRLPTTDSRLPTPDSRLPTGSFRVAGNLPYNVASPIMFRLVEMHAAGMPLVDATLMLQKEVADRLAAAPGTREYGVLSILIGHSAAVDRLLELPPGAFRPVPKVRSSLVRLRFHAPDPPVRDAAVFAGVVQAVFTRRRKTLANALLALEATSATWKGSDPVQMVRRAELDAKRRPETLSIAEFARLADVYATSVPPGDLQPSRA